MRRHITVIGMHDGFQHIFVDKLKINEKIKHYIH